jgi:hypothetical protein
MDLLLTPKQYYENFVTLTLLKKQTWANFFKDEKAFLSQSKFNCQSIMKKSFFFLVLSHHEYLFFKRNNIK